MNKEHAEVVHHHALQKEEAELALQRVLRVMIKKAGPLTSGRYNILAAGLRSLLEQKGLHGADAHQEFVRRSVCHYPAPINLQSFDEALSFVHTFNTRVVALWSGFDETDTGRGDDSHNDLMDALALAPIETQEAAMKAEQWGAFEEKHPELEDLLHAELYNGMLLEDALLRFLPGAARDELNQTEE